MSSCCSNDVMNHLLYPVYNMFAFSTSVLMCALLSACHSLKPEWAKQKGFQFHSFYLIHPGLIRLYSVVVARGACAHVCLLAFGKCH